MKNRNQFYTEISNGLDTTKINLKELNRNELIELAYSLDWNGSWDDDEEGQKPITKKQLIEAITNMFMENLTDEYQTWLDENNFPQISADELISDSEILKTREQEKYLLEFMYKWNLLFAY